MDQALLYVGGFSFVTQESDLLELFKSVGEVKSLNIVREAETGNSRCYGFVEMLTPAQAQKALEVFDGVVLLGKHLHVEWAQTEDTGRDDPDAVIW